jgi:hypothetical protein
VVDARDGQFVFRPRPPVTVEPNGATRSRRRRTAETTS